MYQLVLRFARKLNLKPGKEGIMQISNNQAAIDTANEILTKFKKHGVPNEMIKTERDVQKILNQIENIEDQQLRRNVISPGDPRHKEITERIFGKKTGDVVDLTGKKIDTSKPILGGKNVPEDIVTDTVTRMVSMEPVAAMKEANLVIGRKGKYKNLTVEESQKILKDTDDWIFQRDPDDLYDYNKKRPFRDDADPEDFAHGGRTGFKYGTEIEPEGIIGLQNFDDEEEGDEFSDIEGQTAFNPFSIGTGLYGMIKAGLSKKQIAKALIKNKIRKEVTKKVRPVITGVLTGGQTQAAPPSNINIQKKNIGMPENITMGGGQNTQGPGPGPGRDRGRSRGRGETGQIGGGHHFAQGGRTSSGLNYLLGEDDQNMRVPFKDGTKFDPKRRTVLKGIAALASIPIIGKYFKWAKPLAKTKVVDLTSVPIGSAPGMPAWFKPLVNRVIKEGEDVSKKASTLEREIVHKTELPDSKTDVYVTQDLNTGDVAVDIGASKHGFADGKFGQPVRLQYKASEWIEPTVAKKGQIKEPGAKTSDEFWVEEAEFTGGHPENVKFEESSFNEFGKHESDFSEVEAFAKGKIKKTRKISSLQKEGEDLADHFSNYPTPDDYASGGRVPMWMGGGLSKGKELLRNMVKYFAKESTIGKKPSEYLKISNPKQYTKMLEDLSIYKKYHPGEGIMAPQMIEDMIKKTGGERAGVIEHILSAARNIKKSDKSIAVHKKQMVDAMVEKGADKKSAEFLADGMSKAIDTKVTPKITDEGLLELETIYKNMLMKEGRKLHASGGLAGMLGE
mgnify:CR=1 FL=1